MKFTNDDKNEIKKLLYNSIFFTKNDSMIIYNLFDFIDSMTDSQIEKTKIFLEKIKNLKVSEENKEFSEIKYLERRFDLRLSTVIVILILLKIVCQDQNEEMRFLINKYLEQENYRHFLHILNYMNIEISQNIMNPINFEYKKRRNIFQKLKKIFLN